MVGYTDDSKILWWLWDPEFQKVKAQSDVVFDSQRNAPISWPCESNEIDIFELPENEKYARESDTGNDPLRHSEPTQRGTQPTQICSQPMQIGTRSKSRLHKAPDQESETTHSRHICQEDQTPQHSAENAENIAHSRCLCREDQSAWSSAAAIKNSCQVPPATSALALLIRRCVSRSQGKSPSEVLTASAADPFIYAEAIESPQQDQLKRAMEKESTSILLNNTFSALNSRETLQLHI
jgi:hypothetical protein